LFSVSLTLPSASPFHIDFLLIHVVWVSDSCLPSTSSQGQVPDVQVWMGLNGQLGLQPPKATKGRAILFFFKCRVWTEFRSVDCRPLVRCGCAVSPIVSFTSSFHSHFSHSSFSSCCVSVSSAALTVVTGSYYEWDDWQTDYKSDWQTDYMTPG
jgi:hypothetical protein